MSCESNSISDHLKLLKEHLQGVKQERRVPKALSAQEVYRLQRTAAGQRQLAQAKAARAVTPAVIAVLRDEAVVNLLLYTDLRVGEAATLRLDDGVLNGKAAKVIVRSGKSSTAMCEAGTMA